MQEHFLEAYFYLIQKTYIGVRCQKRFLAVHYAMTKTPSKTLPSVIIPAFNEEKNIFKCLEFLGAKMQLDYQIIVICNGCNDATAHIVKTCFPDVFLYETTTASKASAIRLAENQSPGHPRIYVDADIKISKVSIMNLIETIKHSSSGKLFIPASKTNTKGASFTVKAFYRHWRQTRHVTEYGFGAGVYALSAAARMAFEDWPELISDDGFMRTLFTPTEIILVDDSISYVEAPKTLRQLIKVKHRSKYGNIQLQKQLPTNHVFRRPSKPSKPSKNINFVDLLIYSFINGSALALAKWSDRKGGISWYRDTSSH